MDQDQDAYKFATDIQWRYLTEETDIAANIDKAVSDLFGAVPLPANPHFVIANDLVAQCDRSHVWSLSDEGIINALEPIERTDLRTGLSSLQGFKSAWGLPHMLGFCDRDGLSAILAALNSLPVAVFPDPAMVARPAPQGLVAGAAGALLRQAEQQQRALKVSVISSLTEGHLYNPSLDPFPTRLGIHMDVLVEGKPLDLCLSAYAAVVSDIKVIPSPIPRDAAIALDREDCHVTFGVDILPRRTDGTNTDPEAETIAFSFEEIVAGEAQFVAAIKKGTTDQRKLLLRGGLMLPGRQSGTGEPIVRCVRFECTYCCHVLEPGAQQRLAAHFGGALGESLYSGIFFTEEAAARYMSLWLLSPVAEEVRFSNAAALTRRLIRLLREGRPTAVFRHSLAVLLLPAIADLKRVVTTTQLCALRSCHSLAARMADTADELSTFLDILQTDRVWTDRSRAAVQAKMAIRQWVCLRRRLNGDLRKGIVGSGSLAALNARIARKLGEVGVVDPEEATGAPLDAALRRRMRRALASAQRHFGAVVLSAADAQLWRLPIMSAFLVDMARAVADDPAARGTSPGWAPGSALRQEQQPAPPDRYGRTPVLPVTRANRAWRQDVAYVRRLIGCAAPAAGAIREMLGGSANRRPRSVASARPESTDSPADILVPGDHLGAPPVPLSDLVAAWEGAQSCHLNLPGAVSAALAERSAPATVLAEAAFARYAAESGLFDAVQDAIILLTEPPLVPNPFPDAVRHFRRCGHRLEIRGLSDRQFLAENRNEIAPLAPKSPVHVVRERYSAPEVEGGSAVAEAFGLYSAVAFCDAVALSRLAAALPLLIEPSSAQVGAYTFDRVVAASGEAALGRAPPPRFLFRRTSAPLQAAATPPSGVLRRRCGVSRDWAGVGAVGGLRFSVQLVEYVLVTGHVRAEAVRLYDRLLRQRLLAVLSAPGTILDQAEVPSEGAVWAGGLLEDNLPEVLATVGDAFVAGDEARLRLYCLVNSEYVEVIFRMRFLFASDLPAGQRGATTGARGGAGRNVSGGFGTDRASGLVRDRDDGPDPSRPLWTAADYSQVFFTGRDATRFATWRVAPADSRRPAQPGRGANFVDEDARRAVAEACALAEPSLPSAFEPAAVDLEREAKRLEEDEELVAASRCRALAGVIRQDLAAATPHLRMLGSPARAHTGLRTLNKLLRRLDAVTSEGGRNAHAVDRRVLRAQLAAYASRAAIVVGSPVTCPLSGIRWPAIALLTSLAKRAAAGGPLGEAGVRELKLLSAWIKAR